MKRTKRTKKIRLKGKKKSSKLNNNVNNNIIETREKYSCIKCNKKISQWFDKSQIIRTCNYCLEMDNIKDLKLKQYLSKDKCDICNSSLYINPLTNEVSTYKQDGYFRGCGCRLEAKTKLERSHCPAKKW